MTVLPPGVPRSSSQTFPAVLPKIVYGLTTLGQEVVQGKCLDSVESEAYVFTSLFCTRWLCGLGKVGVIIVPPSRVVVRMK